MKRNDSNKLKARIFCDPAAPCPTATDQSAPTRTDIATTTASLLRLHVAACSFCTHALNHATDVADAVHGLCLDGKAVAGAALRARLEVAA